MKKLCTSLFALCVFFTIPSFAHAEIIHSFDTKISAKQDGVMNITETIEYDFEELYRHGIFRNIPLYSKVGDKYRIISIDNVSVTRNGENEPFSTTDTAKQLNIKIGDADKTITGNHTYALSYSVHNGIGSNFPDHDEIYWNTTGNDWIVFIEKASAEMTNDFGAKIQSTRCFTGALGSVAVDCTFENNLFETKNVMNPGEGLTIVATYTVGSFPRSILSDNPPATLSERFAQLLLNNYKNVLIFLNLIVAPFLLIRYFFTSKKKQYGPPTVNFDIPTDKNNRKLSPAHVGVIQTGSLTQIHIIATLFHLAIQRYIKLREETIVKKFFPDSKEQYMTKLKEPDNQLSQFERLLMNKIFTGSNEVKASSMRTTFYSTFSTLKDEIYDDVVKQGFFVKNFQYKPALFIVGAMFSFFTLNIILGLVMIYFFRVMKGRTQLGDDIYHQVEGLKIFLKSRDTEYTWHAQRFYTVEKLIPYAMSLGYIDNFMEQLKHIKPDYNPTWYSGNGNFYASYPHFYTGVSSSLVSSSSSGSSSGSSGGGGGGGGGGSW